MIISRKKIILLVEDEALIAMHEALAIQGFGYEVISAASGEEAVERATRDAEIDLVLMDIVLGDGIDGTAAARLILERRTVPIVFLSSHSEREIVETVKGITRYGYVIKNSGDFVLRSSIETAFDLFEKQEALQESENRLRDIMFSMVDWVWEVDEKGVYTYSSERSIDIFGHSPGTIVGKTPFDLMPPDEAERVAEIFSALAARKAPIRDLENWNIGKNGEKIYLLTNGVPILDREGKLKGYRGVDKDITERKRMEEALRESENRFRRLAENAKDIVYRMSLPDGVYEYVSPASIEIFGYTPEECYDGTMSIRKIIHPDFSDYLNLQWENLLNGEMPPFYEYKIMHRNGGERWVNQRNVLVRDGNGAPIAIEGIVTDITGRKQVEEKIKSLLAEKELVLKEVHHRIKNNMLSMMGLLTLQAKTMKEPSAAAALREAQNRLRSMLLLYDKLYRSDNFREMSARDYLPSLIDEIVGLFPNGACVKVEKKIEDFPLGIKELSPIGIILNELLTNSMKHAFVGKDGGRITVCASKKNASVTISIGDDGVGIPESADAAGRAGFGLMLVGALTRQLNGSIRIERENGTKFILSFDAR